jgi:hypothetical protein
MANTRRAYLDGYRDGADFGETQAPSLDVQLTARWGLSMCVTVAEERARYAECVAEYDRGARDGADPAVAEPRPDAGEVVS